MGYSLWGRKELDTTERLHLTLIKFEIILLIDFSNIFSVAVLSLHICKLFIFICLFIFKMQSEKHIVD